MLECGSAYLEKAAHENEQAVLDQLMGGGAAAAEMEAAPATPAVPAIGNGKAKAIAIEDGESEGDAEVQDGEADAEEQEDPLEVAWNMFECARLYFEKHGGEVREC